MSGTLENNMFTLHDDVENDDVTAIVRITNINKHTSVRITPTDNGHIKEDQMIILFAGENTLIEVREIESGEVDIYANSLINEDVKLKFEIESSRGWELLPISIAKHTFSAEGNGNSAGDTVKFNEYDENFVVSFNAYEQECLMMYIDWDDADDAKEEVKANIDEAYS